MRSGIPRKWIDEHPWWIYNAVVDEIAKQSKAEFALWTAERLRRTFYQEFGVRISACTVRRARRMVGLTPQRPKRRTTKYSPGNVRRWKEEGYLESWKRARELGAMIIFADEAGLACHGMYGHTWVVKGKTLIVRVADSRFRLNMLAAISPDSEIYLMVHEGRSTPGTCRRFPEKIVGGTDKEIEIIVDNRSIHKAKIIEEWMAERKAECEIYYQPWNSPEVNPVELLRALIKRQGSRQVSKSKAQLRANLKVAFESLKDSPEKVQVLLREEDCKYVLA